MTFVVYAIDSRGNSTSITKSVTTWKNYFKPTISRGTAVRTDGIGEEVTLSFEGTIWNSNFGSVRNEIIECKYEYKKTNESSYTTGGTQITPTLSSNTFSSNLLITGDKGVDGFNISYSYNIRITIKDKINTTTFNILLGAGSPAMALHRNGIAFGVPYDDTLPGLIQFLTNQYLSEGKAGINLRNSDIVDANCIYMHDEATGTEGINFLKQNGDRSNPEDYETLRGYRGNLYYNEQQMAKYSDVYYTSGSTVTLSHIVLSGHITSSATSIRFHIPLPKIIPSGTHATITSGTIYVRHVGGGYIFNGENITTVGTSRSITESWNTLYMVIDKSGGYGITNNTPVAVEITNLTISFN